MMARHRFFALAIHLAVIFTGMFISGCSVLGLAVGSAIDASSPDSDSLGVAAQMPLDRGDKVRVTPIQGQVIEGVFVSVTRYDSTSKTSKPVKYSEHVSNESKPTGDQSLADLVLNVKTEADVVRVPLDEIALLEKVNSKNAKWVGLGIGLVADVVTVAVVAKGLQGTWGKWKW